MDVNMFTPVEEFEDQYSLVELPIRKTRAGTPVVVQIQVIPTDTLLVAMKGFPAGGDSDKEESFDQTLARLTKWRGPAKEIARLGISNPKFSFDGPEDGKYDWNLLAIADQAAVVNGILRVSGWTLGEEAEETSSFHDDDVARGDGSGGAGGGGELAAEPVAAAEPKAQ